jgi:MATE family multidrug resistance protein
MAVVMTLTGFFQGVSRPRITMVAAVAANLLNIFLNWVLIYGNLGMPRLEIAGAAIATSISAGAQAVVLLAAFLTGGVARTFRTRRQFRWDLVRARNLFRIGWAAGLQWTLDVMSWGVFTSLIIGRLLGTTPLAASNIAVQIMHLSFFPTVGLGVATTALVGQYIGGGDPETAHARARTTLKLGMIYMGLMGAMMLIFRYPLIAFFMKEYDADVVRIGANVLILAAAFQAFDAMCIIYSSALKGAGETRFPAVVSVAYNWFIFLPSSLLMGWVLDWGAEGAWGGATLFICALGLTLRRRWNLGDWKKIDIFRTQRFEPAPLVEHPIPHEPGEEISGS